MLGLKLKMAISDRGHDPETTASALGVSRSTLYNLYKKEDIGSDVLQKASQFLNVGMDYWFDNESKKLDSISTAKNPVQMPNAFQDKYIESLLNRIKDLEDTVGEAREVNRELRQSLAQTQQKLDEFIKKPSTLPTNGRRLPLEERIKKAPVGTVN